MSALLTAIIEDLKRLSDSDLATVAKYIQDLDREERRKRRIQMLEATAGSFTPEEADAFDAAIAECEQIDRSAW